MFSPVKKRRSLKVEEIKRISIVSVASKLGLVLKSERDLFITNCPFHSEKTPSFKIFPETNSYSCFGCRAGGDNIRLVQEMLKKSGKGSSFFQTLAWFERNYSELRSFEVPEIKKKKKVEENVENGTVNYWASNLFFQGKQSWFLKRGFSEEMIRYQKFGFNGQRYVIPVWEGEPGNSACLGVRLRKQDGAAGPKYIGLKDHNKNTIWGRHHCKQSSSILAFAGELDACRAVQDGLPAFSVVNGQFGFSDFPVSWCSKWLPNAESLIVVYDVNEEFAASQLASEWNSQKGSFSASVFLWKRDLGIKDYCDFRDKNNSVSLFLSMLEEQGIDESTRLRKSDPFADFAESSF